MPYAAASVGNGVPETSSIAPTIVTIVITVPRSGSTRIEQAEETDEHADRAARDP